MKRECNSNEGFIPCMSGVSGTMAAVRGHVRDHGRLLASLQAAPHASPAGHHLTRQDGRLASMLGTTFNRAKHVRAQDMLPLHGSPYGYVQPYRLGLTAKPLMLEYLQHWAGGKD